MYTNKVLALDQLVQYSYLQTPFPSLSQFSTFPHTQTHHLASPLCRLPVTRFSTILIFSISSQHGIKELCGPSTPGFRKSKTYLWGGCPEGTAGASRWENVFPSRAISAQICLEFLRGRESEQVGFTTSL